MQHFLYKLYLKYQAKIAAVICIVPKASFYFIQHEMETKSTNKAFYIVPLDYVILEDIVCSV